jgi:hypothetical protein
MKDADLQIDTNIVIVENEAFSRATGIIENSLQKSICAGGIPEDAGIVRSLLVSGQGLDILSNAHEKPFFIHG